MGRTWLTEEEPLFVGRTCALNAVGLKLSRALCQNEASPFGAASKLILWSPPHSPSQVKIVVNRNWSDLFQIAMALNMYDQHCVTHTHTHPAGLSQCCSEVANSLARTTSQMGEGNCFTLIKRFISFLYLLGVQAPVLACHSDNPKQPNLREIELLAFKYSCSWILYLSKLGRRENKSLSETLESCCHTRQYRVRWTQ